MYKSLAQQIDELNNAPKLIGSIEDTLNSKIDNFIYYGNDENIRPKQKGKNFTPKKKKRKK